MTAPVRSAAAPRRHLAIGGRTLSWIEAGQGAPLVLLHGIGSNAGSWQPLLPLLAHRRVIAWDAPGYGGSDPLAQERPGPADYADALDALLGALDVAGAVVLGHSLGAMVAAALADRHPRRAAALVLADPAPGHGLPPDAPWPAAVADRLGDLRALGPEVFAERRAGRLCAPGAAPAAVAAVRRAMAEVRPAGYAGACSLLARGALAAAVAGLRLPGLVTCGALDAVVPPETARRVAAAFPGATYAEIPGVGHAGYAEDPAAYAAPVLSFLETVR
ncbi:alpha/beta fold hydrolase [Azospirillum sp. ST 5-10]|uniref:alpha/beta fold hydrolase n=1 Tax=unclassified Azospirillum TaxID=2630922 RepID=UPI003F4A1C11